MLLSTCEPHEDRPETRWGHPLWRTGGNIGHRPCPSEPTRETAFRRGRQGVHAASRRVVRSILLLVLLASVSVFAGTRERKAYNALVTALNERLSVVGHAELTLKGDSATVSQTDFDVLRTQVYHLMEAHYIAPEYDCAGLGAAEQPPCLLVSDGADGYADGSYEFLAGNGGSGYLYTVLPASLSANGSTTYGKTVGAEVPILQVHVDELAVAINSLCQTRADVSFVDAEKWYGIGQGLSYIFYEPQNEYPFAAQCAAAFEIAWNAYARKDTVDSSAWWRTARYGIEGEYSSPTWCLATNRGYLRVGPLNGLSHRVSFYVFFCAFDGVEEHFSAMGDGVVADQYNHMETTDFTIEATVQTTSIFPPEDADNKWPFGQPCSATSLDSSYRAGWATNGKIAVVTWDFTAAAAYPIEPIPDPESDGIVDEGMCRCNTCGPELTPAFGTDRNAASGRYSLGTSDPTNALVVNAYIVDYQIDGERTQAFSLDTRIGTDVDGAAGRRVTVVRPTGPEVEFFFPGTASVAEPTNGNTYRLKRMADETYELHFASGVVHVFGSGGGLASVRSSVDGKMVTLAASGGSWPGLTVVRSGSQVTSVTDMLLEAIPSYGQDGFVHSVEYKTKNDETFKTLTISQETIDDVAYSVYRDTTAASYWRVSQQDGATVIERMEAGGENQPDVVVESRSRAETWGAGTRNLTDTTVASPGAADETTATETSVYTMFPWGEELTSTTRGWGDDAQTTTYAYYSSTADGANYSHLKCEESPDGAWTLYQWDAAGRTTVEVRPYGNTPKDAAVSTADFADCVVTTYTYDSLDPVLDTPLTNDHRPRSVRSTIGDCKVAQSYYVYGAAQDTEYQCQTDCADFAAAAAAADTLVTTTAYYTAGEFVGRIKSIVNPDGTVRLYSYDKTGDVLTTTIASGAGTVAGVTDGTQTITRSDARGVTETTTSDIASGITTDFVHNSDFDDQGRVLETQYLDGTSTTTSYGCCGPASVTDREGTTTTYEYDALSRLFATARNGITNVNATWDAHGNVTSTIRIGTDNSTITTSQAAYDGAGRRVSATDALGNTTTYAYSFDEDGNAVTTTTYPDDATLVETSGRDGNLLSVSGTAAHPVKYEYGIDANGRFTKTILVGAGGAETEWVKTYVDMLGRQYLTVYPDDSQSRTWYNNKGQEVKQTDPDGVTVLYAYNAKGEREYTATDTNQDGAIDLTGTDRVVRRTTQVLAAHGTNVRRVRTYVWKTANIDAATLVATEDTAVNGLAAWSESFGRGSHSQTVYEIDEDNEVTVNVTATRPDGAYAVSEYQHGRLSSVTQYAAPDTQLGQVSYDYDAHGRRATAADARNGDTTYTYNDADQVATVTAPDPDGDGTQQTAQVTAYVYDSRGRVSQTTLPDDGTLPDGGVVHYTYWPTGELRKTWGARVYPVESTYDSQGRMKTLTTWKDHGNAAGAAVTTWNYDSQRGWLVGKLYDNDTGPTYTYTAAGRLQTRTWARLVGGSPLVTTYAYNAVGDRTGIDYSGSTPDVAFTYDRLGRIATVVDAAGTRTMTYTDDGQPDTTTYAGGILAGLALHAAYDTLGRRASLAASQAGEDRATTLYTYDDASRLASVSDGTRTFTYGYLANSALVGTLTVNNGTANVMTTTREYDKVNRLLSIRASRLRHVEQTVVEQTVSSHTYAHNSADQRVRADLADGSHWLYEYDALGQVTAGARYWSNGDIVAGQSFGYAFDDIGNRQTGGRADSPSTYTANALNQYTQRTVPARAEILGEADADATVTVTLPEPAPVGTTYPTDRHGSYYRAAIPVDNDGAAVWQEMNIVGVQQPRAGANDEDIVAEQSGHVFVPATPEAYTYDADGNLLSDGRWSYSWDAENRLIAMETATAVAPKARLEFAYDAESRRIRKQVFAWNNDAWEATTDTRFLYDGWNLVAEFDHQAATVTLKRSHLWGLDLSGSLQGAGGVGGLLCTTVPGDIADTVHYPAYDGNGNVMLYLADDGTGALAVSATFVYSPFGLPLQASGPAAALLPFRFSTKYTDPETRLLYYGYRYYNPDTGRWLNRDPIGEEGGLNLTGIVSNAVTMSYDALGLAEKEELSQLKRRILNHTESLAGTYEMTARLLQHYLTGKGKPYRLDGSWIAGVHATKEAIERNHGRIEKAIKESANKMGSGDVRVFVDYWDAGTQVTGWNINDKDAKYAIQGYTVTSYMAVELKKTGRCVRIKGSIEHRVWDYYDFNKGTKAVIPGIGKVECDDLISMINQGMADSFWVMCWLSQDFSGTYEKRKFRRDRMDLGFGFISPMKGDRRVYESVISSHPEAERTKRVPSPRKTRWLLQ